MQMDVLDVYGCSNITFLWGDKFTALIIFICATETLYSVSSVMQLGIAFALNPELCYAYMNVIAQLCQCDIIYVCQYFSENSSAIICYK